MDNPEISDAMIDAEMERLAHSDSQPIRLRDLGEAVRRRVLELLIREDWHAASDFLRDNGLLQSLADELVLRWKTNIWHSLGYSRNGDLDRAVAVLHDDSDLSTEDCRFLLVNDPRFQAQ